MMPLKEKVISFFDKEKMDYQNVSVLVACSGGVDSMVLLSVLQDIGLDNLAAAHCNFNLRESSGLDEDFVKDFAKGNQIIAHTRSFDTHLESKKKKKSIQVTARELRYEFFEELINEHQYDFLATAHHLSDSLETSIYNLAKGTGISGMRGILPIKNKLIRPLSYARKEDVLAYAKAKNIPWREDETNSTDKYTRNFIRHQIIPKLKEINPNLENTFADTSQRLRELEKLLQSSTADFEKKALRREGKKLFISPEEIKKHTSPLLLISELLKPYHFNYKQAQLISEQLEASEPKLFEAQDYVLQTSPQMWLLKPRQGEEIEPDKVYEFSAERNQLMEIQKNKFYLKTQKVKPEEVKFGESYQYLDIDKTGTQLRLRKWRHGDSIVPMGMKGSKTVGNLLTDKKIPALERNVVWVIEDKDDEIVWVGLMSKNSKLRNLVISEKTKLSDKSESILSIEVLNKV